MSIEYSYLEAPDCQSLDHIPGIDGMPLLGRTLGLVKDLHAVVNQHVDQFGHVSRIGFTFQKGVMITHPDDLQTILLDKEKNFSSTMGYRQSMGTFYGGALLTQDFDLHKMQRRIFQAAFKNTALKNYVGIMGPAISEGIESWGEVNNFKFVPEIRKILLDVTARTFFGLTECRSAEAIRMNKAFKNITEKGLMSMVKLNVPGTKYYAGQKGKSYLENYIKSLIPARRMGSGTDLMSMLTKERDENGEYWTDEVLVPHLSLLLFAAHDTTTSTLSHLFMYLARPENHHIQEKLRQQALAFDVNDISFEQLSALTDFENCLNEALRLNPSVTITPRRCVKEFSLRGYTIPAHTMLYIFPHWAHRSEEYWTKPNTFDPDRFERKEHKKHSFSYIPFGGGVHKCLGMHFAYLNAKVFMIHALRKYRFDTVPGYDGKCETLPMPVPSKGLPMKVTKVGAV